MLTDNTKRHIIIFMNTAIKKLRTSLGLTQLELAQLVSNIGPYSIEQSTISNYERGERIPKIEIAKQIVSLAKKKKYRLTLDDIYSSEAA